MRPPSSHEEEPTAEWTKPEIIERVKDQFGIVLQEESQCMVEISDGVLSAVNVMAVSVIVSVILCTLTSGAADPVSWILN